jgi:signal transduction histidine kinase
VGGFGGTQQAFENLVHRDDLAGVVEMVNSAFKTGEPTAGEWRVVWPDGSVHWIVGRWQVFMNESGEPLRMVGVNMDVTDRKLAEEAVAGMSGKLIKAQEQERTRIGRELHDDINQRLAMLALELEQLQANPSEVQTRLQELRKQTIELSDDVQALSHELHSSKLEYLGVVPGIKSWCKEFGERQAVEIDFKSDVSSVVPFDVGICLFRVLQESLHNAANHSDVKRIEVQLREVSNEIHLIVTDLGRGFDVEAAIQGQGLGLTSMQERVRLLNGSVDIESKPMAGTTIHVRVPFGSEHATRRAAG